MNHNTSHHYHKAHSGINIVFLKAAIQETSMDLGMNDSMNRMRRVLWTALLWWKCNNILETCPWGLWIRFMLWSVWYWIFLIAVSVTIHAFDTQNQSCFAQCDRLFNGVELFGFAACMLNIQFPHKHFSVCVWWSMSTYLFSFWYYNNVQEEKIVSVTYLRFEVLYLFFADTIWLLFHCLCYVVYRKQSPSWVFECPSLFLFVILIMFVISE